MPSATNWLTSRGKRVPTPAPNGRMPKGMQDSRTDAGPGPQSGLTIYIVEDSPPVRERLIETVGEVPNARVVGQAATVTEALDGMRNSQPRVLILDVQLRGGSGIRLLKQMRATGVSRPELVIVITNYPTDDYRKASQECGADHFFDKASEFDKVRDVLLRHGGNGGDSAGFVC